MASFGLVHGAMHGAWCWERLSPELTALGHEVWTVDLPDSDPDAGAEAYAQVAVAAFAAQSSPMVVVGHSLGGLTIPLIAQQRPVSRLVFLCAVIPMVGRTFDQQDRDEDIINRASLRSPAGSSSDVHPLTLEVATNAYYNDLEPPDAAWAHAHLIPQSRRPMTEVTPLTAWPEVPSSYILGTLDQLVRPDWSRRAATQRLGRAAVELDTGHSPFLSQPRQLAAALDALAAL